MEKQFPNRKNIRLQDYDYSSDGLYFVTICCQDRKCVFGDIRDGEMILNEAGKLLDYTWNDLPNHNPNVELDAWCIMPNHVHGIIIINNEAVRTDSKSVQNKTTTGLGQTGLERVSTIRKMHGLSEIIRQLKTFSARRINQLNGTQGVRLWQRNYYEHIIRNQKSYENIANYIYDNPVRWINDDYYYR